MCTEEQIKAVRTALHDEMCTLEQKAILADAAAKRVPARDTLYKAQELSRRLKDAAERYHVVAALHRKTAHDKAMINWLVFYSVLMTGLAIWGAFR